MGREPAINRRVVLAGLAAGVGGTACRAKSREELAAEAAAAGPEEGVPSTAAIADGGGDFPSIQPVLRPAAELEDAVDEEHASYAPKLPRPADRDDQRHWQVDLEVLEGLCDLDPENDVQTVMWGYRVAGDDVTCGTPGPVLRGRVGDVATITLANPASSEMPHNIDFHAVTGQGGGAAALTVQPGQRASITVRLLYPGAFMYHCAFGDVPEHIARGMYGMFVVDPEEPLPPTDHEWAVMQSEWYVGDAEAGVAPLDRQALLEENPRYVTFNGRIDALRGPNALAMEVGQRARIYMVNEGLNLDSNFHPIGSHWDAVWPEAATHPVNRPLRGSQSTLVVAGGGTVVDLVAMVPSTILLVDHALIRTFYKGALGEIVITGGEDAEIFSAAAATEGGGTDQADTPPVAAAAATAAPIETTSVSMPEGAYSPANADEAYSPLHIAVPVGATVTWTNDDTLPHTVTSGISDGRVGSSDGSFDSGTMDPGDTFSHTFDEPGIFPYFCVPHPWMRATVTVG